MPPNEDRRGRIVGDFDPIGIRIARRSAVRLGRLRHDAIRTGTGAAILQELTAALRLVPPAARRRALTGPDLRGFLSEAELWGSALSLAGEVDRRGLPARRRRALVAKLFDRAARSKYLVTLVPGGRVDRFFPRRVARLARRRLLEGFDDLAAFVLGLRLARPSSRRSLLTLRFREEPEQGRPRHRIDLGTVQTDEGPVGIERRDGTERIDVRLSGRTLILRSSRGGLTVIPAAGSRLRRPADGHSTGRNRRGRIRGGGSASLRLVRRERIPGSPILLAPALRSRGRRLSVGSPMQGAGVRLSRALGIVRTAWPEGYREILSRTIMVVPVREPRLVSYSLASRPGISFINLAGKRLIDLADDLLHETAHHRLHDLEELAPLLRRGAATDEVQAFDSPWHGTRRPLHGLLHGAYTFLFRAELFIRILESSRARPGLFVDLLRGGRRRWLRSEIDGEIEGIGAALQDLTSASRERLLTGAGRRLLGELRARHSSLRARVSRLSARVRPSGRRVRRSD